MEFYQIKFSKGYYVIKVPTTGSESPLSTESEILIEQDKKIQKMKEKLKWYHDRLINIWGEDENLDYHIQSRVMIEQ